MKTKVRTSHSLAQYPLVTSLHIKSKRQRLSVVDKFLPGCGRLNYWAWLLLLPLPLWARCAFLPVDVGLGHVTRFGLWDLRRQNVIRLEACKVHGWLGFTLVLWTLVVSLKKRSGGSFWTLGRKDLGVASLVAQWLRLHASTAGAAGLIPGWGSSACCEVRPKKNFCFLNSK